MCVPVNEEKRRRLVKNNVCSKGYGATRRKLGRKMIVPWEKARKCGVQEHIFDESNHVDLIIRDNNIVVVGDDDAVAVPVEVADNETKASDR